MAKHLLPGHKSTGIQDEIFTTGANSVDYVELTECMDDDAPTPQEIRETPAITIACMGLAIHQVLCGGGGLFALYMGRVNLNATIST